MIISLFLGFEGIHCERSVKDCSAASCAEGRVCVDGECRCAGSNCSEQMTAALTCPVCRNNGTCNENLTCDCPTGWTGESPVSII